MIDWHRPLNKRERIAAIIGAAAGAAWAIIGLTALLIASPAPVERSAGAFVFSSFLFCSGYVRGWFSDQAFDGKASFSY